jgi:hypothetical protein
VSTCPTLGVDQHRCIRIQSYRYFSFRCLGPELFLQVRTQVLNNDLAAHFKRWYPGFTHHGDPVELAA